MPNVSESGSLNLLEPSGPVQTCTGIACLLLSTITKTKSGRSPVTFQQRSALSDVEKHHFVLRYSLPCSINPSNFYITSKEIRQLLSYHSLRANLTAVFDCVVEMLPNGRRYNLIFHFLIFRCSAFSMDISVTAFKVNSPRSLKFHFRHILRKLQDSNI